MIRKLFIATAFIACTCVVAAPVSAQFGQGNSANNLFSQYATPNGPSMTTAGMYPAPHYSPQLGAQSYYTYQPLMPHEMMYQHSRNYYNYYNSGGYYGGSPDSLNKTSVRWQSGTNHMGPLPFNSIIGGHKYKRASRIYCLDGKCEDPCEGGNCGGRTRHRHRGGLGCVGGDCGASADVYSGGCSGGSCAANPNNNSLQR